MSIMSVSPQWTVYDGLHMHIKVNLKFSVVSVWMRNVWKMPENVSVDGECFEMKTSFSNGSGLM